jgi:hypothetical protein
MRTGCFRKWVDEFTYHLRNTNTKEIEVSNTRKLEKQLGRDERQQSIARSPDIVGDVSMAAPRVDQGLVMLGR